MGIVSGKDLLSSKYVTAEIADASKRVYHVPIKTTIGDYFLTEINKQVYCFKIVPARILTSLILNKSFRILQYSTKNYLPISAGDNALLEQVLRENSLPKVNYKLLRTLKLLGNREKQNEKTEFSPQSLVSLVEEISQHENEYTEQVQSITNYLQHLQVKQIVTPVREVTEFLEDELTTTDPRFLGDIVSTLQRVDLEHKKVTNVPIKGKMPILKIILIVSLVGIIGGVGYYLYSSGALSSFSLGGFFGTPATSQDIMHEYPTPEALKLAISQGKVSESSLPPDIKREVDAIKLPATPPPTPAK